MTKSFYVLADTHFFEPTLGCSGPCYEEYMKSQQKCLAETQAINDAVVEQLIEDKETTHILIAGDLSRDGEFESHAGFLKRLERLRANGKKIFVITAGHDYNENAYAFGEKATIPVRGTSWDELYEMYYEYGFSDALSVDTETHSYVNEIFPGVSLFALNCDGPGKDFKGFDERQMSWIAAQAAKEKEKGNFIFAMNHYPLLPGSPAMTFVSDAVIHDAENVTKAFADMGINLCFTGHMHMQSIKQKTGEKGNKFFDVCTGSLVGCPAYYRKVTILDNSKVEIESIEVPEFEWDKGGRNAKEYFTFIFERMLRIIFDSMAYDYKYFCSKVGMSSPSKKLRIPITLAGKFLSRATLGSLGKILFIKVEKNLKPVLLKDFCIEIARNIFVGDQPYVEGTDEYNLFMRVLKRFSPIIRLVEKKLKKAGKNIDMKSFIAETIGNSGISDYNAVLETAE